MNASLFPALTPPPGYRFMSAHEADQLQYADPVRVWNGAMEHGVVTRMADDHVRVTLRSGAILTFDLDNPDYWPDGESRDRRPPHDGENVILHETGATADEDVEPLLRTSAALARAMKDDVELQEAVARLREIVRDRLAHRVSEAA